MSCELRGVAVQAWVRRASCSAQTTHLDLLLHVLDGVARLHIEGDGLTRQGLCTARNVVCGGSVAMVWRTPAQTLTKICMVNALVGDGGSQQQKHTQGRCVGLSNENVPTAQLCAPCVSPPFRSCSMRTAQNCRAMQGVGENTHAAETDASRECPTSDTHCWQHGHGTGSSCPALAGSTHSAHSCLHSGKLCTCSVDVCSCAWY